MSFIRRHIEEEVRFLSSQFRALGIIGPRQSGKKTLCRALFNEKPYVSLENPVTQSVIEENPEAFLEQFPDGAILDEVQRVPELFRYLQGILDERKDRNQFILTGSNNFLLQERISQSLAGRIGYLQLLPLSFAELSDAGLTGNSVDELIQRGGYPEIWDQNLDAPSWTSSYVQTYVQRDVRLLRNISDLSDFTRFLMLCANRAGQLINREEMGRSIGVSSKTIQAWLGVLESSFIIFQLHPWYRNLNKRIIKSPKLYFYDTGLLCHLLGIQTVRALRLHQRYGSIFENWIIAEIRKNRFNRGINEGLYFFRDSAGNEVDLLVEKEGGWMAVEIKSGEAFKPSMLSGLQYWLRNNPQPGNHHVLVFGGEESRPYSDRIQLLGWNQVGQL